MPTIRRTEETHLFVRDDWAPFLKSQPFSLRVLNPRSFVCPTCRAVRGRWPLCSPDHPGFGFTRDEIDALKRIAAGDDSAVPLVPGGCTPEQARWALDLQKRAIWS
jgi:hypothetical protein